MTTITIKLVRNETVSLTPWVEAATKARQRPPQHPCHDYWSERSREEGRKVMVITSGD